MKILLSVAFLLLIFTQKSFGQTVDKDIQAKWGGLKAALKARAGLVVVMTSDFLKQGKDNKKLVYNTNLIAKEIKGNSDSLEKLDSKMVKAFYAKNDSLENQTMQIIMSPKIEKDAATIKEIDVFVVKMDATDKAINKAKKDYNASCKATKREDLQYVNPNPDEDNKVQF
jgi:hypothetical protein